MNFDTLIKFYKDKSQIVLISIAYIFITFISIVICGLVALFNQNLGVSMLIVPLIAFIAAITNIIVWSMVRFLLDSITVRRKKK